MTSITAADLKLGGRLVAAADAIGSGHLRRAAGIFNEIADDLNVEAENVDGLMADEVLVLDEPVKPVEAPAMMVKGRPEDLQMCSRNVHSYGAPDSNGWRTCAVCGNVNVAPPDNNGPIDMSARQ